MATSVGEEGLDVPEVDLVVFYEPVPSAIRSIQRRGRTGRHRPGRVVILMAKGTRDEAYYWASRRKEKGMFDAIKKIARELEKLQRARIKAQGEEGKIHAGVEKSKGSVDVSKGKIAPLDAFLKPKKVENTEIRESKAVGKAAPQASEEKSAEKPKETTEELPIKPIFVRKPKGIVVYVDSRELRSGVPKHLRELAPRSR